jgi:hypothetical protein
MALNPYFFPFQGGGPENLYKKSIISENTFILIQVVPRLIHLLFLSDIKRCEIAIGVPWPLKVNHDKQVDIMELHIVIRWWVILILTLSPHNHISKEQ